MKKYLFFLLTLILFGCAYNTAPNRAARSVSSNIIRETDDEKHEIVVLDAGFESWFLTNAKPVNFHTLRFYETQNAAYVSAWNQMARTPGGPITNEINYDPNENYGVEVNYKLYWYFKYMESIYGRYFFL